MEQQGHLYNYLSYILPKGPYITSNSLCFGNGGYCYYSIVITSRGTWLK